MVVENVAVCCRKLTRFTHENCPELRRRFLVVNGLVHTTKLPCRRVFNASWVLKTFLACNRSLRVCKRNFRNRLTLTRKIASKRLVSVGRRCGLESKDACWKVIVVNARYALQKRDTDRRRITVNDGSSLTKVVRVNSRNLVEAFPKISSGSSTILAVQSESSCSRSFVEFLSPKMIPKIS